MTNHQNSKCGKDSSTTRRSYLGKVGGTIGIGAIGFTGLGAASEGDTTEIVTVRNGDGPVKTEQVPTDWYERELRAREGSRQLKEQYLDEKDIVLVGIIAGEKEIQGLRVSDLRVGIKGSSTEADVPAEVNGIPVKVETNIKPPTPRCYEKDFETTPAGAGVLGETGQGDYQGGTATCRAIKNGTHYLMTANHIFHDEGEENLWDCQEDMVDREVGQYTSLFGYVSAHHPTHDIAVAPPESNRGIDDNIVDEDSTINGWVTKDGVSAFKSDNRLIRARGTTTCTWADVIDSYDNTQSPNNCNFSDLIYFENAKSDSGDSGGPYYFEDDQGEHSYLVGPLSATVSGHDYAPAAYAINNDYGYEFG